MSLLTIKSALPCTNKGKYHIGHSFPLYLFPKTCIFSCKTLNPKSYKQHTDTKFVITKTHLFQIQTFDKSGHLVAFGSLESIKTMKISNNYKERLTIV